MEDSFISHQEKTIPAAVKAAQQHVLELFNKRQDARLVYHNYQDASALVRRIDDIGNAEQTSAEHIEQAQLAAWFLNTGYLSDYTNYLLHSLKELEDFLLANKYPQEQRVSTLSCLEALQKQEPPKTAAALLFQDAFQINNFIDNYFQRSPLLKLEWELMDHKQLSKVEWAKLQFRQLLSVNLRSHFSRTNFEPILGQLIRSQKELLNKYEGNGLVELDEEDGALRKFQDIEKKVPARAIQTFFRSNYRNHINLSNIADGKANIMISVNSILISVLISILTYRNITATTPFVLMPIVIFLLTGLASFIFAILSARPKVTSIIHKNMNKEELKKNIVFFGNFVKLDLDQFEDAMDAMFRDGELMYGNMTRDLYYLGKVLDKKYRFLAISYTIFMVGFIASVVVFLVALFTNT